MRRLLESTCTHAHNATSPAHVLAELWASRMATFCGGPSPELLGTLTTCQVFLSVTNMSGIISQWSL